MRYLALLLLLIGQTAAAIVVNGSCPQTSGPITASATATRASGISPLLVFYNATGTTYSGTLGGVNNAFQDLTYTWNFGDTLGSGTSTWAYGANPGVNKRNVATGAIAAHLYVTEGRDTKYTTTLTVSDGTTTVSCGVGTTAFDPSGANGFPGTQTVCLFNTTVGSGCPAGATQTVASTFGAVNANLSNKRLLYKCGDSFAATGSTITITGTKGRLGAYGGCENTKTNRPQFTTGATANNMIETSPNAVDIAISDIDFEGTGGGANIPIWEFLNVAASNVDVSQFTVYNIKSQGNKGVYFVGQGNQTGLIDSFGIGTSGITDYVNGTQNNCANFNTSFDCGQGAGAVFININYHAHLGNYIQGQGGTGGNIETTRVGACRFCVFENNYLNSPISAAASLKVTNATTNNSLNYWLGQYTEYVMITDNLLGTLTASAPSGATPFEIAPQNGGVDERFRYIVMERNVISAATNSTNTRLGMFTGQNMTFRDNVCYYVFVTPNFPQTCNQFGNRGPGTNGSVTPGAGPFLAMNLEGYNNTAYANTGHAGMNVLENDTVGGFTPATASFFKNNLLYAPSGGSAIVDTGGNTVSNNTVTATCNPNFPNTSGTFFVLTDWKPTACFSGGTSVPVQYDALGVAWSPTWDLGAVHH